jgi:hypothetical protein
MNTNKTIGELLDEARKNRVSLFVQVMTLWHWNALAMTHDT